MKKFVVIALFVGLLFACANPAYAILNRFNADQTVLINIQANEATDWAAVAYISTADILVAGSHRILGYTITPLTYSTAANVGIYDASSTDLGTDVKNLEAEAESESEKSLTIWFPYPYEIKTGIAIHLGPSTALTIYYERP